MYGSCHDGTGNIGTAAGERFDSSVRKRTVETRDNGIFHSGKTCPENAVGLFAVKTSVIGEENIFRRIQECIAEIVCKKNTIQVLTAGSGIILACTSRKLLFDGFKFHIETYGKAETVDNFLITCLDGSKLSGERLAEFRQGIALIEHIGNLGIGSAALSGSGRNDKTAVFLSSNNGFYFFELFGTCQ